MVNLWHFFGLPDPEGNPPVQRRQAAVPADQPVALKSTLTVNSESKPRPTPAVTPNSAGLRPVPLGWTGPLTPDGEPFHDLGMVKSPPLPIPTQALRYVAPDEMKRIHSQSILKRVIQGDTVIVDLRPLVHMDSHQMACRRELKHMGDQAGVEIFALDTEDKLLMIPGIDIVVDMQKRELGLTPLL
ncbi:MAG: hypothetical protein ISP83_03525 [Candidatus Poseidonia sp.]|nr:hypothetical protein [Poseidonia sp.]MBL6748382.1 hypothetical protein [Poseidonia sp.]MBL6807126.1 hypothetical protein [Poseidonia sp.]MBL6886986.1 hypothetical protein [Poseidonia sp.]MBL6892772.1 hypothetical protein [Poseidonia sp.]